MSEDSSTVLQGLIDRMNRGDDSARDEVVARSCERLRRLTRKMMRDYPLVQRWEDSDDVMQNALLRLMQALRAVPLTSTVDFFRLAARHIRWELLDLARHYSGPQGMGAHHASNAPGDGSQRDSVPAYEEPDTTHDAGKLAVWTELHGAIEELPEEEKAVFDLLWYQDMTQAEAAAVLNVSVPTIKRRWLGARLRLQAVVRGDELE